MPAELIIAIVLVIALILYAILGGTDYGVGVWVLFLARKTRNAPEGRNLTYYQPNLGS